jgi:hypothetical protein
MAVQVLGRGQPKLTSAREKVITKAFEGQPSHLPDLDHWVIWTHQKLRKTDWEWIKAQAPEDLDVRTWWDDHVADLLSGDLAPLEETYFGSAVLMPAQLSTAHEEPRRRCAAWCRRSMSRSARSAYCRRCGGALRTGARSLSEPSRFRRRSPLHASCPRHSSVPHTVT